MLLPCPGNNLPFHPYRNAPCRRLRAERVVPDETIAGERIVLVGKVPPPQCEFQPVIQQYGLRFDVLDELIKGCEMDLDIRRYETYEALELYL